MAAQMSADTARKQLSGLEQFGHVANVNNP